MERFYDGDQEKLFAEARVVNPFRKGPLINRTQSSQSSLVHKILYYSLCIKTNVCVYVYVCIIALTIYLKFLGQKNFNKWYRRMWNLFYCSTICSMYMNTYKILICVKI